MMVSQTAIVVVENMNQYFIITTMKVYRLTWYLEVEDQLKEILITDKEAAEERYQELKKVLYKGCWLSLSELVENEDHVLVEGKGLHYNDI